MTVANDIKVKCCRCRNQHMESERVTRPSKDFPGAMVMTCPRCSAHDYYRLQQETKE